MTSVLDLGLSKRGRHCSPTGDQGDEVCGRLRGFIEDSLAP